MDDERPRNLTRDCLPNEVELLKETVLEQARVIAELRDKLIENNQRVADLVEQLEEARSEAKRQAAPFRVSDKKRKRKRKKPGRKKGHPVIRYRYRGIGVRL